MQYVAPDRWKLALTGYIAVGALAGLLIEPLSQGFAAAGAKPVLGVVIVANLVYPALIVAVATWHPRARLVPLGAVLSLLAFTAVRMAWRDIRIWEWSPDLFAQTIHPVIVMGTIVAAIVAAIVCVGLRGVRVVGVADAHLRCGRCGYLVRTLGSERPIASEDKCPECGASFQS